ncbi:TetR/AcrR family transcriptional regulator [Cryptosporangium phraense]|uniref:TetR/AcrR family transcriptional regulator n=1 Tax=Cryptosporangium phraense TaxID=2593070 RepID=UPI001F0DF4E8|nr:TetR/AcrR family transcriptional regulator [Cryptosporangium phraense]
MRADARRNRERVLSAAEDLFGARGTSVSTEEIAQAAGVGVGTVFRHFPTKEELLEAVFKARLDRLADEVRHSAETGDPATAFRGEITRIVDQSPSKNAITDALAAAGVRMDAVKAGVGGRVTEALGLLLRRAQEAGAVRPDVDVPTLIALLVGAAQAVEAAGDDPVRRARVVTVLLDGLSLRAG